jgi:hypothetical protein
MTRLPDRFIEDRALRDAARAVLTEDVERLRASLAEQGIASRLSSGVTSTVGDRIRAGAQDVFTQLRAQAGDHKGWLALLVGAIILWFARGPILDWLDELDAEVPDEESDATPQPPQIEGDPA